MVVDSYRLSPSFTQSYHRPGKWIGSSPFHLFYFLASYYLIQLTVIKS